MKKLLTAVIMLSIFSGMAVAQEKIGHKNGIDENEAIIMSLALAMSMATAKEFNSPRLWSPGFIDTRFDRLMKAATQASAIALIGLQLQKELNKEINIKIKEKQEAMVLQADIDMLTKDNPEFAKIQELYTDIKNSWPSVREKIAGQAFVNNSFIFQHFTVTMDKYLELAELVKNFKNKKDAPALGKSEAARYLKELAKLIDEPFAVKWSKEPFITSPFIYKETTLPMNYKMSGDFWWQVRDFARQLRKDASSLDMISIHKVE
jgi:hypothetical protein